MNEIFLALVNTFTMLDKIAVCRTDSSISVLLQFNTSNVEECSASLLFMIYSGREDLANSFDAYHDHAVFYLKQMYIMSITSKFYYVGALK